MSKTKAVIIKHSICPRGNELITFELTFARFLLSELNTHRMFSKNSASSRAIPFKKMVEMVQNDPFIPIAWQKEHKGMQGSEYWTSNDFITLDNGGGWAGGVTEKFQVDELLKNEWTEASKSAIKEAERLNSLGITKQLCNRLLEPFMWHKVVLTTGLEGLRNFFELRCPEYQLQDSTSTFKSWKEIVKNSSSVIEAIGLNSLNVIERLQLNKGQAEIHMMELAEQMYDTYNESIPQKLESGQWHIPYCEQLEVGEEEQIKASTGLCARTSYLTVGDDKSPSIEILINIHDKMKDSKPFHASPFEHCARVMDKDEYRNYSRSEMNKDKKQISFGWCRNYRGFIQYRHILEESLQK